MFQINNKLRIYLIFVFLLLKLSIGVSNAQKLEQNQIDTIRKHLYYFVKNDAYITELNNGFNNFCVLGNDTFFNVSGFHLLYQIKDNKAIRLDRSSYHGHNFFRYFFAHDTTLYLLGGYGFFTTNNNLEYFDLLTREWLFVPTKGERPDYVRGLYLRIGDSVFCINNSKSGNSVEADIVSDYIYILDLKSKSWSKIKNNNKDLIGIDFYENYLTENYIIGFNRDKKKYIIVNKVTQEYLVKNIDKFSIIGGHFDVVECESNSITIKLRTSIQTNDRYQTINLDQVYQREKAQFKKLDLDSSFTERYFHQLVAVPFATSFLIISYILFFKKSNKINVQTDKQTLKYIESLRKFNSNSLTIEELDTLFEIDHMESESKKSKRHRLLTIIKTNYPGFITRVKDENDKRRFVYLIDKEYFNS